MWHKTVLERDRRTSFYLFCSVFKSKSPAQTAKTIMANWSKVKRGILICSLSGLNFAIRNMNFISLAVSVNYFSKYRIKENSLLSLRRNYFSHQMCKKNFFIFARFLKTDHRYSRNSKERWYKNYFIELSCSVHAKKCSRKFMVFAYISVHRLPKKDNSQYGINSSTQSKASNYGAFRQTEWTVLQWALCRKLGFRTLTFQTFKLQFTFREMSS